MVSRRGPGRPPNTGRPRKIEEDYIAVSEGYHLPMTREASQHALRWWEDFLRERGVDSDAVTVHDFIAFKDRCVHEGLTPGKHNKLTLIRGYYYLKGSANPDSKWSKLSAELQAQRLPDAIGKKTPHKPIPLELLPKILEASRHVRQFAPGGAVGGKREVYSEAYTVVATFLYEGGRAQWYSLTDAQVEAALDVKSVELFVKKGQYVWVPVHDRLLAIWKEHLDHRDFEGPAFFRHGRNPFTYQDGNKDWKADVWAARGNISAVKNLFHWSSKKQEISRPDTVEEELRVLYNVDEHLTSHRFRKSVGTYMAQFGYDADERRLQLSHGAGTITDDYDVAPLLAAQKRLSKLDLGNADWISAHVDADRHPLNLFAGGNGDSAEVLAELKALRDEVRAKDRRIQELTDRLLGGSDAAPLARIVPPDPPEGAAETVRPKVIA